MTRRLVSGARRLVVGARRHARRLATPLGPVEVLPFPQAPLAINVKIWVDSSWLDITPWVYGGDRARIEITRGRPNESGQVDPSRATFQLNNRDGQFSPRNPVSWLYGKIGRNTQVRIAIGEDIRFCGEISEWPPRWDITGTDIYTPIEASGVLRRLTQGAVSLKSTMYRALTTLANPPKAYWPCEDGTDATEIAAAIGNRSMTLTGTPSFASHTEFKCSAPLPTLNGSRWRGQVPDHTSTGKIQVRFLMQVPAAGSVNGNQLCRFYTTGSAYEWQLIYNTGGGDFTIQAYDIGGTNLLNQSGLDHNIDGDLVLVAIGLEEVAGDVEWTVRTLEVGQLSAIQSSGTLTTDTIGRCTSIITNGNSSHTDVAMGHISIHDDNVFPTNVAIELNAHTGETAGRRIERLCSENDVEFSSIGGLDATAAMGPQQPDELINLLREAADADGGILYESRGVCGLAYRTRESMYNQPAGLTLDYATNALSSIEPVEDDQLIRNDITARRMDGSSFRAVKETGSLSILAPPNGVGRYDEEITLNLQLDRQLPDQAGWRLHLGTVDEARYPVLGVNLARPNFAGDPALTQYVRALDLGDRLVMENPPAWLPPDDISQLAQGFAETLAQFMHTIDINCSPESPWGAVAVYDGTGISSLKESRYSSAGSTLSAGITSSATSLSVATPAGPLWTHADGDYDIKVGGEVMTVTNVTGASSPQTFTVTRSVNGVVKEHLGSATVELAHPVVYII